MSDKTIIAIHGVGETKSGDILRAISPNLNLGKVELNEVLIDGFSYKEMQSKICGTNVIEVNWSDLMKPRNSWISVIKQGAMLIVAMLSFSEQASKKIGKFNPVSFFRFLLEGLVLGASTLPIISSIGIEMHKNENFELGIGLMVFITALFGFITIKGIKYSKNYRLGLLHLLAMIVIGVGIYLNKDVGDSVNLACNRYRTVVIILISSYWLCWTIYSLFLYLFSKTKTQQILTEIAFVTLPYIAFNAYGTILTLTYVVFFDSDASIPMDFDLKKMEIATTIIYSIIGIIPLIVLLIYFLKKPGNMWTNPKETSFNSHGYIAQKGIKFLLLVTPFLLISLSVYASIIFYQQSNPGDSIRDIYQISILRIIPFIGWFIGPLAIITDVLGDVLFYISPEINSNYSINKECKNRLKKIVENQIELNKSNILILAHSWGTVVASDVIQENNYNCKLITLGSPIESLCFKILGRPIPEIGNNVSWINVFRNGDYIAGPINYDNTRNINIGEGGHTDYWSSKKIGELIINEFEK